MSYFERFENRNFGNMEGFKNKCGCGSNQGIHETGNELCLRFIVEGDEIPINRRINIFKGKKMVLWDLGQSWVSEYSLFNQRMFKQHKSGDWSRPKSRSSKNSIQMRD